MFYKNKLNLIIIFTFCGFFGVGSAAAVEGTVTLICESKSCSGSGCETAIGIEETRTFSTKVGSVINKKTSDGKDVVYKTHDDSFVVKYEEGEELTISRRSGSFVFFMKGGWVMKGMCNKADLAKNKF